MDIKINNYAVRHHVDRIEEEKKVVQNMLNMMKDRYGVFSESGQLHQYNQICRKLESVRDSMNNRIDALNQLVEDNVRWHKQVQDVSDEMAALLNSIMGQE